MQPPRLHNLRLVTWKPEWTLAVTPIAIALIASAVVAVFGGSASTAQWAAIIAFLVSLPFVIGRLMDLNK
jgi:chromate transport protein ChrA